MENDSFLCVVMQSYGGFIKTLKWWCIWGFKSHAIIWRGSYKRFNDNAYWVIKVIIQVTKMSLRTWGITIAWGQCMCFEILFEKWLHPKVVMEINTLCIQTLKCFFLSCEFKEGCVLSVTTTAQKLQIKNKWLQFIKMKSTLYTK